MESFIGYLCNALNSQGVARCRRMNMTKKITTVFAFAAILTASAATSAKPKITMAQARVTALKKAPGKVTSEELENEHGKLIYSFDIATSKTAITEVNVDALNGRIVAVQHENAAKEAAEKKQEAGKHGNVRRRAEARRSTGSQCVAGETTTISRDTTPPP